MAPPVLRSRRGPSLPQQRSLDPQRPVLLGRQAIFDRSGRLFGYELLYRSLHRGTRVDRWSAVEQDRATRDVVTSALRCGLDVLAGDRPTFINATRSLLVGAMRLPVLPTQIGIEVVESVVVDDAVLAGVRRLREHGHLVAVDDFSGHPNQLPLLPHADIVKIDLRDLVSQGPGLLDLATGHGARVVVERVETPEAFAWCLGLGFDLFQGHHFEAAAVLDLLSLRSAPRRRGETVAAATHG